MASTIPFLLEKKRDGHVLSAEEIKHFVSSVVDGSMEDSQIGAMLMAMYLVGLTIAETIELTKCMTYSGQVLDFPEEWGSQIVDKHSTGGIGDKISLVLAPTLAALGFKVPMVSGRGLGFTGGTLDKLESIPGFKTKLTNNEMRHCLESAGCFIAGATGTLAPADAILYKQRDITRTVDCLPLIVSSILSKKVAEGTKTLVIDVKVGKGSFMKTEEDARTLSTMLVEISKGLGVDTKAVISRMDCPVGFAIGNAVELVEAIQCLQGGGPKDVQELVYLLAGIILVMKGRAKDISEGKTAAVKVIQNGLALNHFYKMLISQGVEENMVKELLSGDPYNVLTKANKRTTLNITQGGFVADIDSLKLGLVCWELGAGRNKASDKVDHSVGIVLRVKPGDLVRRGDPWVDVLHSTDQLSEDLQKRILDSIVISTEPPTIASLVVDIL